MKYKFRINKKILKESYSYNNSIKKPLKNCVYNNNENKLSTQNVGLINLN